MTENPDTTVSEARTRRPASDYADLRKLAEACPPEDANGRWYKADELGDAIVADDRPFIAACSPTVVLGLLDELDRLRGVVHAQRVAIEGDEDANSNSKAQLGVGLEPIVRTVGDLTARHIGRGVRVAGLTGRLLSIADGAWEGPNLVALAVVIRVTDMRTRDVLVGVNAECEVLP